MKAMEQNWGKFLPRALVLGAIIMASVFVAVRAAVARPGEPGGNTRTSLTVAGSLMLPSGVATPNLTFRFYRGEIAGTAPLSCGPITVPSTEVAYTEATHSFSTEVPIDTCQGLFNGENVWVTTTVTNSADGGVLLPETPRSAINPVPYARYADQYGTPDCPVGYERTTDGAFTGDKRLCQKRHQDGSVYDEVVRVGAGATAFWVDRYEATAWHQSDTAYGVRTPYGQTGDDYLVPDNGQWGPTAIYALSVAGYFPSRFITWFQASEACRAVGKRLPTGDEWLTAARGTSDPSDCRISPAAGVREAGNSALCKSYWGAHDMIGNLWEWTSEWTSPGNLLSATSGFTDGGVGWPAGFNSDQSENFPGQALVAGTTYRSGVPAAIVRGGSLNGGVEAGVFAISAIQSPTLAGPSVGFRCVIPR